jgi:prepilin-type N-terminal cleavage/methylation domain-containing protein/prepilin-type processing-associated H-X9-DG protein
MKTGQMRQHPDGSISLSSFGGEGRGEEAVTSGSRSCPGLPLRTSPSPQPSPRAPLAGRGRRSLCQSQGAPGETPASRVGFTLVELLVVIAVIGILAGLLLPVLGKSKLKAHQVVCVSNFRQLTAGWKMYSDDNGGKLVSPFYFVHGLVNSNAWVRGTMNDDTRTYPPVEPGALDSTNFNGLKLGSLYRYTQSAGVYHCPADRSSTNGVLRVRSYSLNGWMGGTWVKGQSNYVVFKREADIVRPPISGAWVFIDEHERSINDGWFAVDMKGDRGLLDAPATRHNNSYALSFADGHAEIWKLRDRRSINWTALPISNNPLNPDWQRLQAASSSLKQ